ncbi:hypothetical protein ACFVRD_36170 [Streptomyces sp. NPDC057908]|uniref:hypothetical protein n=1 Tax=Streptomyces sp. NPDC057908 TaxID=3346276 RepID=UPI0036EA6585
MALDIPEGHAGGALNKLRHLFGDSDLWTRFEVAEQLALYLDTLPWRVDYARRLNVLDTWQMPRTDWTTLCEGLPQAGRLTAQNGTTLAVDLVWAETTQADHLLRPLLPTPHRRRP